MRRRDFIRNVSAASIGAVAVGPSVLAMSADEKKKLSGLEDLIRAYPPQTGSRTVTCAIIGAGGRGNAYNSYLYEYKDKVKLVAVSDINEFRCNKMADMYGLPAEKRFGDFRDFFKAGKIADCVFICLPDDLHYEAAMLAMELKYDVLLEKPMAQTEKECKSLLEMSHKQNIIMGTCHVLRYAPFFLAVREAIRKKVVGDLVRIDLTENVERVHMSHSYVRGNWHNSEKTTPIILSKSCHDLDILRWLIDKPCKTAVAQGELNYFKKENAPEGAPLRCTDGCPHESTCPFSAINIYLRKRQWNHVIDKKTGTDEEILDFLKTSDYGRCVYHMDNDQPDYYVANFRFEGGLSATFTMESMTPYGGRVIRVIGSKGFIEGNSDKQTFKFYDFRSGEVSEWSLSNLDAAKSGHGGGDWGIARDFVEAVAYKDPSKLSTTIDVSMESHIMGFKCEKSRSTGKTVSL